MTVHELDAIDEAALLLLNRLVADIEAGRVAVVSLKAKDAPDRLGLVIDWAMLPAVDEKARASRLAPDDIVLHKAGDPCPSCSVGRIVDLVESFGCGACGWPGPAESD